MGLATRVIPTVLCSGRKLMKGERFNSWRSVGLAAQAVRIHQKREVDELVLLDIMATKEDRGPDLSLVEELTRDCFMPLAVGGGVRTLEQARDLLRAGADKVVIGTAAINEPGLIRRLSDVVGAQAVVVSVDVKNGFVWGYSGTRPTSLNPVSWSQMMQVAGAGEILLTSIDREGTMNGYDLKLIRSVAYAVEIPVVAHGGCSGYGDMVDAVHAGASAVAAGALFQFTDATPKGAAQALASYGIEARV